MLFGQHTQGAACLQTHVFHGLDQVRNFFNVTVFRRAPSRPHTETRGTCLFGRQRRLAYRIRLHHFGGIHTRIVMHRLWAIATVFWAAPCFDRQQGRKLHLVRVEMLAVHLLRLKQQLWER